MKKTTTLEPWMVLSCVNETRFRAKISKKENDYIIVGRPKHILVWIDEESKFILCCSLQYILHWLHLCRGVPHPKVFPRYDVKKSDGEAPLLLEIWSTHSLLSPTGPLWPGVVSLDSVLSKGQIKLHSVITLNWLVWNQLVLHMTVRKQKNCALMLNWIVLYRTVKKSIVCRQMTDI